MEKICLTNIYLLHWYGFNGVIIPIDKDFTFITGENESGKSTILDAFKYAFIGDTEFNKSSGTAKRDLKSYTRCLIDPTSNTYARPADKYPTVYTHIALEFFDKLNNKSLVLGVVIETSSSNDISSTRYRIDGKKLNDIRFTYFDKDKEVPYSPKRFCEQYQVKQMQVNDGLDEFMNAVGLRLNKNYRDDYKRKLRNMMTYKAESRIPEFMKKFVLEEKPVDFKKLKDSKKNIDQINVDLQNIKEELAIIDGILKNFSEYENVQSRIVLDKVKDIYEDILTAKHSIEIKESQQKQNKYRIEEINRSLPGYEKDKDNKFDELTDAKVRLSQVDGQKAIDDEESRKKDLEHELSILEQSKQKLHNFQKIILSVLNKPGIVDSSIDDTVLASLESRSYSDSEKEYTIDLLKNRLNSLVQKISNENGKYEYQRDLCAEDIEKLQEKLEQLNKNQIDSNNLKQQTGLIREINREFEKQRIHSEAKMAFQFVADIEDDWQNAIEAFLNVHRYAIIVEPEYFDVANRVLDKSEYKHVELVRTKALDTKRIGVEEDSVVNKLQINDSTAKKYFEYWLGRIHAVDLERVSDFDNALSKEGKISRNMSVSYLDFRKLREYYLGFNAIEKTRKNVESDLKKETEEENRLLRMINENNSLKSDYEDYLKSFKEYDYSSSYRYIDTLSSIKQCEERINELKTALQNNSEYMTLYERVTLIQSEYSDLEKSIRSLSSESSKLSSENERLNNEIIDHRKTISDSQTSLDSLEADRPVQVKKALQECKLYDYNSIRATKRAYETKTRDDRKLRELEGTLIPTEQKKYNERKKPDEYLPVGVDYEAAYQRRKNQIQVEDLDKLQSKMKAQTRKYEQIFKNDFCTRIYQEAKDALSDIRNINKELRNLGFSTKYQFAIDMVNDGSDYSKIIKYSEYLEKTASTGNGQLTLDGISGYTSDEMNELEEEILNIINRISSKEDNDEEILKFSDYRNYLNYEILISNEDITEGRLSRQIGYDSGAATQIPYLLILAASLSMFYNQRENCTRLIFIDEPFEKMSDDNIKKMMDFFRQQNFQVIICAPSNKMDSIGSECNTIVPVLKFKKESMIVGKVQFHEE